jgi:DNA topoisomerase-3
VRCATAAEVGGGDAWRLYDYICRHFLATVSPDLVYEAAVATFAAGAESFEGTGRTLVSGGFALVMPWHLMTDVYMPAFVVGETVELVDVALVERATQPPSHLTESDLIGLMEQHQIGTDASIATHIQNILDRRYVEMGAGRTLVPRELGKVLAHGYSLIDPQLVEPNLRSEIEKQLALIAKGEVAYDAVLAYALRIFQRKFEVCMCAFDLGPYSSLIFPSLRYRHFIILELRLFVLPQPRSTLPPRLARWTPCSRPTFSRSKSRQAVSSPSAANARKT